MTDYAAAAPVLLAAAGLIEERGFTVGQLRNPDGCLCVHGAISTVVLGFPEYVETGPNALFVSDPRAFAAIKALFEYLSVDPSPYGYDYDRIVPEGWEGYEIASWNDSRATKQTAVAALTAAAQWSAGRAAKASA
jgi:hypothetical protein